MCPRTGELSHVGETQQKAPSARRNIALILLLVLPIVGLVVTTRMLSREAVLMFPEEHEARLAKRASPENVLGLLAFAVKALPVKPPGEKDAPPYATEKWWNGRYSGDRQGHEEKRGACAGT